MADFCNCVFNALAKGELPDPIPWFPTGTTCDIEVLSSGKFIGIYQITPACNHEHQMGNFILGALREAGFNPCGGNLKMLDANTTYLKICLEHKYIKIDIDC